MIVFPTVVMWVRLRDKQIWESACQSIDLYCQKSSSDRESIDVKAVVNHYEKFF